MEDEQFFVQIRDPVDMRRGILGSSRQLIQVLQRYERIKELRVLKLEQISKLRKLNKAINLLVAKLKKEFPAAKIRVNLDQDNEKPSRRESAGDDLFKLESDLQMIEDKISRLA